MRLGMMQPYFFPYLGYFGLIHATDHWIVFDTPQYIRRGWVNRNRVLSNGQLPWKYARVPVAKCDTTTPICRVKIDSRQAWQEDLFNNLDAYRSRMAPYFRHTEDFLKSTLSLQTDNLSELLVHCLKCCCDLLNLSLCCDVFSTMNLPIGQVHGPGDWAFQAARSMGATAYVNPPGGRSLFDAEQFRSSGIELRFLNPSLPRYHQGDSDFMSGLSIIDALMWNDVSAVRDMVTCYELQAA